jgi:taurine dioxygenase
LGAEIRGVDLTAPIGAELSAALRQAWYDHLVLLFRGQSLDEQGIIGIANLFGGVQITGARRKILAAGQAVPARKATRELAVTVVSNLDDVGNPTIDNGDLGSLEVLWHTDNSFVEVPPAGTFLYALEVPRNGGGDTSFSNQYIAWETLPAHLKKAVWGRYQRHDWSRNSAGRLRITATLPKAIEDVQGPVHPLVRHHPYSGRRALYLGRRREWPSNYILGIPNDDSERLLDELWRHASREEFAWTHAWKAGDAILWDNRCTMHHRTEIDPRQRRLMWRTLVQGEEIVPAWENDAEAAADAGA